VPTAHINGLEVGAHRLGRLLPRYMQGNRILAAAILQRRTAHDFLKRFGEGIGGFVAKGLRDFGNGIAAILFAAKSPLWPSLSQQNGQENAKP
jgi:hypothetical protein